MTRGDKGLQGVAGGDRGLRAVTGSYGRLQRVTGVTSLKGVYKGSGDYRDYMGLQRVTRG